MTKYHHDYLALNFELDAKTIQYYCYTAAQTIHPNNKFVDLTSLFFTDKDANGDRKFHPFLYNPGAYVLFSPLLRAALEAGQIMISPREMAVSYLHTDMYGSRLLDRATLFKDPKYLKCVLDDLLIFKQNFLLSPSRYDIILTKHARSHHSVLHEIARTGNIGMAKIYIEALRPLGRDKIRAELEKENIHNYTALQQGINNGAQVASLEFAKFFMNVAKEVYTKEELYRIICKSGKGRLRCQNDKENGVLINAAVLDDTKNHLHQELNQSNEQFVRSSPYQNFSMYALNKAQPYTHPLSPTQFISTYSPLSIAPGSSNF